MSQTSDYTKYGLDRQTWVALCSLILTGPLAKVVIAPEPAYDNLITQHLAVEIEMPTHHGVTLSLAATPDGARLFCQCLNVSTVPEGIAYLQARNILHRASNPD